VSAEEIKNILVPLEFKVAERDGKLAVDVPTFRATKDIAIEADIIEEVARSIGYNSIAPKLPEVTVRYAEPDALTQLDRMELDPDCINDTLGTLLKYQDDIAKIRGSEASRILGEVNAELASVGAAG